MLWCLKTFVHIGTRSWCLKTLFCKYLALPLARSLARSPPQSIVRSIGRSLARSVARSLDRSLARSIARSIHRTLEIHRPLNYCIVSTIQICLGSSMIMFPQAYGRQRTVAIPTSRSTRRQTVSVPRVHLESWCTSHAIHARSYKSAQTHGLMSKMTWWAASFPSVFHRCCALIGLICVWSVLAQASKPAATTSLRCSLITTASLFHQAICLINRKPTIASN